jgi:hypothetical protein
LDGSSFQVKNGTNPFYGFYGSFGFLHRRYRAIKLRQSFAWRRDGGNLGDGGCLHNS